MLFEVRCDDHNVQIGGYPWHYIITPHGTMGYFSVHSLKDHKLVSHMSFFKSVRGMADKCWIFLVPLFRMP